MQYMLKVKGFDGFSQASNYVAEDNPLVMLSVTKHL